MKDLKGYEDVVVQMTAKLAHACDVIKTKLTQESLKPVEDFEVSCEGMTKATITFRDEWLLFGETMDTQRLYKAIEDAVSSDPENLKYCLEKDYSCGGLVKIELQDHSKYLGNYEMLKPKDESYEKNKYLCNLLEENFKYHNRMVAMRTVLDKHNLMGEVEELLKEIGLK